MEKTFQKKTVEKTLPKNNFRKKKKLWKKKKKKTQKQIWKEPLLE